MAPLTYLVMNFIFFTNSIIIAVSYDLRNFFYRSLDSLALYFTVRVLDDTMSLS